MLKEGAEHHCLEVQHALGRIQLDLARTHLKRRGEIVAEHHFPGVRFQLNRRDVGSAEQEELSNRLKKLYESRR